MSDPHRRYQAADGPAFVTERRALLKWSSAAAIGALALGGRMPGFDMAKAFAAAGAQAGESVDLGKGDVSISVGMGPQIGIQKGPLCFAF